MDGILFTLNNVGLAQMVLGWLFVATYALAVGGLLSPKGSLRSGLTALAAGVAFTALSDDWVHGALLVLFAIAGLALFVIAAWILAQACVWLVARHERQSAKQPSVPAARPSAPLRPIAWLRTLQRHRVLP